MSVNNPPFFNAQFVADNGTLAAGYLLYTYVSGTTTNQTSYQDRAGLVPNTNPIVLDAVGRCDLWLTPTLTYRITLKTAAGATIRVWNDVTSSTGGVTPADLAALNAANIAFTTGTSTTWFAGTNVADALDSVITKVNTVSGAAITASAVGVVDTGNYYTATNVETVLAEVAARGQIPSQTSNAGKFLKTDGTALSWATAGAPTGSISTTGSVTFPGGLIFKWGRTATIVVDTSDNVVTFATAFPTACFQVIASCATGAVVGGGTAERFSIAAHNFSVSGFLVDNDALDQMVAWFAIGN